MTASGNVANAPPSNSGHVGHAARESTTVHQESKVARDGFQKQVMRFGKFIEIYWNHMES